MADQVRVFVSHHHSPEEDSFTARLVADLEAAGADVWVDVVGVGAADFQKRINEALAHCNWFVLVLTPAAIASQWVEMEVHAAVRLKTQGRMRGIIQVLAAIVAQDQIPPTWGIYAHFDATRDYATALDLTLRELRLTPSSPDPSPPPIRPALPAHAAPPDRFPPRLAELGYQIAFLNDAEVILPPMCDVPAGPFLMGSDPAKDRNAQPTEQPQHWVTLEPYQIAQHPVTVAEYSCFLRATGRAALNGKDGKPGQVSWQTQLRERLEHPVVVVTWQNAVGYAKWLSERTGHPWRLPSEAEWEKAARWDAATGTGYIYPWGDTFDATRCNTSEGRKGVTTPVGSYPDGASPYGVQDMAGNVWEWTGSVYKPYPYKADGGREQGESAEDRILRGGSWHYDARLARAASRNGGGDSGGANLNFGFRLARSVPNS